MLCFQHYNCGGQKMEAITVAGIAVVVAGGYYSAVDLLNDFGITIKKSQPESKSLLLSSDGFFASQRRVKKMAGMHI